MKVSGYSAQKTVKVPMVAVNMSLDEAKELNLDINQLLESGQFFSSPALDAFITQLDAVVDG